MRILNVLLALILFTLFAFPQNLVRIRLASSSYSGELRGTQSVTLGITIVGSYESAFNAHEFAATTTGAYDLYVNTGGGFVRDAAWSGPSGKLVFGSDLFDGIVSISVGDARYVLEGQAGSITGSMIVDNYIGSLNSITNKGGNLDLTSTAGLLITPQAPSNTISFFNNSPLTIDGVSNPEADIDFVAGAGMMIVADDVGNTITFTATATGGNSPPDDLTIEDTGTILRVKAAGITSNEIANNAVGTLAIQNNSINDSKISVPYISSLSLVENKGGNIDLVGSPGVIIIPDDTNNRIDFSAEAPSAIDGVRNPESNIDLIAGSGINIVSSDAANTITISSTGGLSPPDDVTIEDTGTLLRVKAGGITTVEIATETIVNGDISDEAINARVIEDATVDASKIAVNGVDHFNIAADAVRTSEIQDNAVTGAKIPNNAITGSHIAALAVTNGDIANATIQGNQKIVDGSITGDQILNGTIEAVHIDPNIVSSVDGVSNDGGNIDLIAGSGITIVPSDAANTITFTATATGGNSPPDDVTIEDTGTLLRVKDNGITQNKIAQDAITEEQIADDAVQESEIENGAVTSGKLSNNSVSTLKIQDGAVTDAKIGEDYISSLSFVKNKGGNINLNSTGGIEITPDDVDNDITFSAEAPNTIEGVSNPEGNIDFVPGTGISITGNDGANTVTITNTVSANSPPDDVTIEDTGTLLRIKNSGVQALQIATNAVGNSEIASSAVDTDELASSAVTTAKIENGAVTEIKIANNAVTADKIGANEVTSSEIATNAVDTDEIAADAVESSEIATNAVGSSEIAANAVGSSEIASGAVGFSEIADGSVRNQELDDDAVTTGKIQDLTILDDDIAVGAITANKIAPNIVSSINTVTNDGGNIDIVAANPHNPPLTVTFDDLLNTVGISTNFIDSAYVVGVDPAFRLRYFLDGFAYEANRVIKIPHADGALKIVMDAGRQMHNDNEFFRDVPGTIPFASVATYNYWRQSGGTDLLTNAGQFAGGTNLTWNLAEHSLTFDPVQGHHLEYSNGLSFGTYSFIVCAWIRRDPGSQYGTIGGTFFNGATPGFYYKITQSPNRSGYFVRLLDGTFNFQYVYDKPLTTAWEFHSVVVDGRTSVKAYIDLMEIVGTLTGDPISSVGSIDATPTRRNLHIGKLGTTTTNQLHDGDMGIIAIYIFDGGLSLPTDYEDSILKAIYNNTQQYYLNTGEVAAAAQSTPAPPDTTN